MNDRSKTLAEIYRQEELARQAKALKETEEAQQAELLKKQAKKKEEEKKLKPKQKYYYDVKVECLLPATLTYRVLAEDPQQAITMIKGLAPNGVRHRLPGRKELKVMVYDAGSSMIRLIKSLLS